MSGSNLAGRYAKALFELADKNGASEKIEGDLARFAEALQESRSLKQALENPVISKNNLEAAVSGILKKLGADKLTLNFFSVVIRNGRIKKITEIVAAYNDIIMKNRGEELAYVTTATPLNTKQVIEVEKTIASAVGGKIKAVLAVNDEILGGIIVRIGSKMLDSSVAGKLGAFAVLSKKNVANLN